MIEKLQNSLQSYSIINEKIDLNEDHSSCNDNCKEIVYHCKSFLIKSCSDLILAVLPIKNFKSPNDFFIKSFNRKKRNQFRSVEKKGYKTRAISVTERNKRLDELYEINTSTKVRQGEMSEEYFEYPDFMLPDKCSLHFYKYYGVFSNENKWVGYILSLFCGEFVSIYKILGHADFQKKDSFLLNLWFCMVSDIIDNYKFVKYIMYHMYYVGKPGLQSWKKNVGLIPAIYDAK